MSIEVNEFREVIDTYFEGPDPRITRFGLIGKPVGGPSPDNYRDYGSFSVHRYEDNEGIRTNGNVGFIGFTGISQRVGINSLVTIYAKNEDEHNLYRQLVFGSDLFDAFKARRPLMAEERQTALEYAKSPLTKADMLGSIAVMSSDETPLFEQHRKRVADVHASFKEEMDKIDEANRQAQQYMNNARF